MSDYKKISDACTLAIRPIRPISDAEILRKHLPHHCVSDRSLPPYYLVYILFVDLLGYPLGGPFEKVAWSIPFDFEGQLFFIEHRKFGLGLFASTAVNDSNLIERISRSIKAGTTAAKPFYETIANKAVEGSDLNVVNLSSQLWERYLYFVNSYHVAFAAHQKISPSQGVKKSDENGTSVFTFPGLELQRKARWAGQAAIDAFFAWTEHVFIHISVLLGKVKTGLQVEELSKLEWGSKYQAAIGITDPDSKRLYDKLLDIRRQHRNFIAHGAFGKRREAFDFHSGAGAIPVHLTSNFDSRFRIWSDTPIEENDAINVIKEFVGHVWKGEREPAGLFILTSGLPVSLSHSQDGSYSKAMASMEEMESFIRYHAALQDRIVNMDY